MRVFIGQANRRTRTRSWCRGRTRRTAATTWWCLPGARGPTCSPATTSRTSYRWRWGSRPESVRRPGWPAVRPRMRPRPPDVRPRSSRRWWPPSPPAPSSPRWSCRGAFFCDCERCRFFYTWLLCFFFMFLLHFYSLILYSRTVDNKKYRN